MPPWGPPVAGAVPAASLRHREGADSQRRQGRVVAPAARSGGIARSIASGSTSPATQPLTEATWPPARDLAESMPAAEVRCDRFPHQAASPAGSVCAMVERVYVAAFDCSDDVAAKINSKHGVTLDEVREAVLYPSRLTRAVWIWDADRGSRLVAEGVARSGRVIRAVLYPVDPADGTWRLGTAVPLA